MSDVPASPPGGGGSGDGGDFGNVREQDRFLPIANIGSIMKKAILANGKIAKDAKETLREARDKCQREKRKTINVDDLLWAMATLGFEEYIEPLYLQKYREVADFGLAKIQHEDDTTMCLCW
uniref:Nuclear transcription factor Y subunit B n=1 Tax=Aegilops tauschii TaxID=37682 RepID=N1QWE7_AEGTA